MNELDTAPSGAGFTASAEAFDAEAQTTREYSYSPDSEADREVIAAAEAILGTEQDRVDAKSNVVAAAEQVVAEAFRGVEAETIAQVEAHLRATILADSRFIPHIRADGLNSQFQEVV